MRRTCCVADCFCTAPANLSGPDRLRGTCYSCGQPVCENCSLRLAYYHYGRRRLCHNCIEEHFRSRGAKLVKRHLDRLAGVPQDKKGKR